MHYLEKDYMLIYIKDKLISYLNYKNIHQIIYEMRISNIPCDND